MTEEPAKKSVSRQYRYQLDKKAQGLCIICGKPRSPTNKNYCQVHREYTVMRNRINNARRRKFDFPYRMWERALIQFTKTLSHPTEMAKLNLNRSRTMPPSLLGSVPCSAYSESPET